MSKKISVLTRDERDLLITLNTKMENIEFQLSKIDSGVTGRLLNLESNAVTKIVFDNISGDHEIRIRRDESWRQLLIGAFVLIQLEIPVILWFFSR